MGFIHIAILLFGSTSIMGMYLSFLVLRNIETQKSIIKIHSVFSLIGFAILFKYYPDSLKSIIYFLIATVFGLILLYQDLNGQPFTKWLCFMHAITTVIGFVYLLMLPSQL